MEKTFLCAEEQVDPRQILGTCRIGLWRLGLENGKPARIYADAMMDELLGITGPVTPEQRQTFFSARIHPDDAALFAEYARRLTETQTEIVYRYIHPVRGEMVIRCSGRRDPSCPGISIIGTHQDITDTIRLEQERQAERRLAAQNYSLRQEQKEQESYYRELLDIQNCGLLAYTVPGYRVIHMNAEALRMYRVSSPAEFQANLVPILKGIWYPDASVAQKLIGLRNTDGAVDYECILYYGTPKACHIMAKSKNVRLPNGERAVVTTFLDVSDMILLRQALHRAEEGSRAKSSFLFAMSHDLRTPMNAILGYADLIEAHWGEEASSWQYLQKLKQASRFLLGLIGNVLEVARIESGKETLHEAPWDLNELHGMLDLLESDIGQKKLQVRCKMELPHPYVLCDSMKLREVLMNLLSNAVKYTPEGGTVGLTVEEAPAGAEDKTLLRITVKDNGIGIAEAYIPHLFEAFTRERDSSESGILGTGLGLRIVKSFVDLMGGTIAVESMLGHGSCFTVELPLTLSDAAAQQAAEALPSIQLAGRRILMAEDNALNAEITSTVLSDAHIQVDIAQDGLQAVEMLQHVPAGYYDLILMDIQMPRMNGYDAARAIRALPDERAKTPIAAMTANAFEEDRQAAFDAGMDAYATKPIEPNKLMKVIAETMK